mmetsp:Transcript_5482/g.16626  ORF Transcript_5482/g.16626 Transcript_5482/m.16626 type:complete len:253 (+) Transcript_5482:83-841(+)
MSWSTLRMTRCTIDAPCASPLVSNDSATPGSPARPVRPMRCTYVSGSLGMSKLTTAWTAGTSRPRAATSVATSTGVWPCLNEFSTASRSCWRLSPWMEPARNSRIIAMHSWSHIRLVEQKTMMRAPGGLDLRIFASSAFFSCMPLTICTFCVMDLLATSFSSTPPMNTCTVWLTTNCDAIALTSRGHVALKNSVCRALGSARTIFWICGSKPMSSMRSASSSTRYETWPRRIWPASRKSFRRPGVAMTMATP